MKLSVIIPVYNVEPYLQKCLDSVLAALARHPDAEVICIDDGSTDGSAAILKRYMGCIRILTQANQGLSAARNAGLEVATGEWISFVDSDDWVEPDYFDSPEEIVDPEAYWCESRSEATAAWGKLYPRTAMEGLRFPVGKTHEDELVVYRVLFGGVPVRRLRGYHYVRRPGSIMHGESERDRIFDLEACEAHLSFFRGRFQQAYATEVGNKIRILQSLGRFDAALVAEYRQLTRGTAGRFYWPEHFCHPWLVNWVTWKLIVVLRRLGVL